MKIKKVFAEEVFNAQGIPTIQCSITLENNITVHSSVPSGFNHPDNSAFYLYDKEERFFKKGMLQACAYINETIAPLLEQQPINVLAMDSQLMDLDTSIKKSSIGANTTLAVSITLFKAQAAAENIQPFELLQSLSGTKQIHIPKPIISIIEGRTENTQKDIKEFLLIPQEQTFEKNIEAAIIFQHHIKRLLSLKKQPTSTGVYGSFVPFFITTQEAFTLLQETFETLSYEYQIGLNIIASELYDLDTKTYQWNNQALRAESLIQEYQQLITSFPYITYLQNGISDYDRSGWKLLTKDVSTIQIAGDSLFSTNPMLIRKGILDAIANIVIIRPEHIGTISQTIAAVDACKNNKRAFIIASDVGQTNDTFISDLAVGTGANFIKSGAVHNGEHITKYNRIITIERYLQG